MLRPFCLHWFKGMLDTAALHIICNRESKLCSSKLAINQSKVSKGAKIRNRYNQVPHLTQDTNGKVTNSQLDTTNESLEVSPFQADDHKAHVNRHAQKHNKHKILLESLKQFKVILIMFSRRIFYAIGIG